MYAYLEIFSAIVDRKFIIIVIYFYHKTIRCFQLLIAFETGLVVVWDLRSRMAEWRGALGTGGPGEGVRAAAWQQDGKLMTAHADGALATWTTRSPRPVSLSYPHGELIFYLAWRIELRELTAQRAR